MKLRWLPVLLALGAVLPVQWAQAEEAAAPDAAATQTLTAEQKEYLAWAKKFVKSLNYQKGEIELPGGVAKLTVPDNFYYLSPEDAEKVLTEAWGNPAGSKTLGMLFPAAVTPIDPDAWGVTIEYSDDGYVNDDDAKDIDYNDLLKDMKDETRDENKDRVKAGYQPIELVGWAAQPYYDGVSHKLHWAQELKFGDDEDHTLNYNIRVLGRKGYLRMNFVADMKQLPEIERNLDSVLAMAEFNDGYRYEQFKPNYDKIAAYGIGGLVAGKVLAKVGFLGAALLLLKKFGVIALAGGAALFGKIFKRKQS